MRADFVGREIVDGAVDGLCLVGNEVQAVLGGGRLRLDLLGKVIVELFCTGGFARGGQAGDDYELWQVATLVLGNTIICIH